MRQIEGWCAWCGERFLYTPSGPQATLKRFCGKKHRDRANNAKANLRANLRAIGHIPKGVHSPERAEQQRQWLALSEEGRQAIRERAYAEKMAKRAAREMAST